MFNPKPDHIILPLLHPPMYLMMHKYWARKPHNIVASYIKKYSKKGEIILDPFCGSGVTIVESLLLGRKGIGIDINPFSIFLTENTIYSPDLLLLQKMFDILIRSIKKYKDFFIIECPHCRNKAIITQIIWRNQNQDTKAKPDEKIKEIRILCKICKFRNRTINKEKFVKFYHDEEKRVKYIDDNYHEILKDYKIDIPNLTFYYKDGKKYRQLRHYLIERPNQSELFTKRNLISLGIIKKEIMNLNAEMIGDVTNLRIQNLEKSINSNKNLFLLMLTAILGQSSKMVWVISKRKGKYLKKKEIGSWSHHFFCNFSEFFETNPIRTFFKRFEKTLKSKKNLSERIAFNQSFVFKNALNFPEMMNKDRNTLLLNLSSKKIPIPDNSIHYIFTDPPYGDSIQYFELSSLWNHWLDLKSEIHEEGEITINHRQNKSLDRYSNDLYNVFSECFRVLIPGRYMTVTFHNTDIYVRNSLISSVIRAGFVLQGLIFQMPPRNSIKSYLHYDKSPVGDYFLRFKKLTKNEIAPKLINMDYMELKQLIEETVTTILLSRAEPTPEILIFNLTDEILVKNNLYPIDPSIIAKIFSELKKSEKFLLDSFNKWWFQNHIQQIDDKIPLTERIKHLLKSQINSSKNFNKKSLSEIYNIVYKKFNSILTPTKNQITSILTEISPE